MAIKSKLSGAKAKKDSLTASQTARPRQAKMASPVPVDQDPPIIIKPGGSILVSCRDQGFAGPPTDLPAGTGEPPHTGSRYLRHIYQTNGTKITKVLVFRNGVPKVQVLNDVGDIIRVEIFE